MKGQSVVFSTGKDNWQTPRALFDELDKEFHFTLDGAADETNHLCERWLGPGSDKPNALDWLLADERIFCNPPYTMIKQFVAWAAMHKTNTGTKVVMLIPSRTDTKYWHEHIWDRELHRSQDGVQVRFLKGRVKFTNPDPSSVGAPQTGNSAPFPSAVVVFG